MLLEMVNSFPQSLMSLGADSGVLMQAVIRQCDDLKLFKKLLDLYHSNGVTPLLPYGPKVRHHFWLFFGLGGTAAMTLRCTPCICLQCFELLPAVRTQLPLHPAIVRTDRAIRHVFAQGKPLLAAINSYHEVAAVIDCVVEMGDAGATMSAAAMASGRRDRLASDIRHTHWRCWSKHLCRV